MKQFFAFFIALCAVAFSGCSEDDEGAVGGMSGMWAYSANVVDEQEISTDIVELYEISGGKVTYWMFIGSERDIPTLVDGYLVGYNKSDFESMGTYRISVSESSLTVGGLMEMGLRKISDDKVYLWDPATPSDVIVWERVKGYR